MIDHGPLTRTDGSLKRSAHLVQKVLTTYEPSVASASIHRVMISELDKVTAAVQSRTKPQVQLHIQRYIYKLREEQARQASAQQANQGPSTPTGAQPQSAYAPTASQQPTQTQQPASQLPQQPPSYNPPPHLAHLTPQQLAQLSQRAHQSAAQPSQATPTQPLPQSAQYAYQQQVSRGAPPSYSTSTAQQGSASKPAYGAYSAPTAAQPRMAPGQATPSGSSLAQPKQQGVSAQGAPSSAGTILAWLCVIERRMS